jgi:hypothetical protein
MTEPLSVRQLSTLEWDIRTPKSSMAALKRGRGRGIGLSKITRAGNDVSFALVYGIILCSHGNLGPTTVLGQGRRLLPEFRFGIGTAELMIGYGSQEARFAQ